MDSSGKTLVFPEADELEESETTSFHEQGRDLWIARKWDHIRSGGFHWKLTARATSGVTVAAVLAVMFTLGFAALMMAGASQCNENDSWRTERRPDGSVEAICSTN